MFDQLSDRLQQTIRQLSGKSALTMENMDEALKDVRRALLEADVSLRVVKQFVTHIRERAEGEAVLKSVEPGEQLIKLVHDELMIALGGEHQPLMIDGDPSIIMLFGLQGSGKTTTCGKLALHLRKHHHKKPLLIAADVYRPAAIQQLITLGKQIQVPVFSIDGSTDVSQIAKAGLAQAKADGHDIVLIDTAGRLQVDTDMMAELLVLERTVKPQEKLLVIDSMTGQEAINVAEAFNTQLSMTGIVLTKLDGDSRGGAALSVVDVTHQPIKLVGVSEKLDGIEPFHPDRMATRILGMGDVVSLVEKAQQAIDLEEAQALEAKIRKSQFTLSDFVKIQRTIKKLGSLEQILAMLPIPGIDREMRSMLAQTGEQQLSRVDAMINSMTVYERENPDNINASRKRRIAAGCGIPETELTLFLKQFDMMRSMMKGFTQLADGAKMGGGLPPGMKLPKGMKGGMPNLSPGQLPPEMAGLFNQKKKKAKKPLFPPFSK